MPAAGGGGSRAMPRAARAATRAQGTRRATHHARAARARRHAARSGYAELAESRAVAGITAQGAQRIWASQPGGPAGDDVLRARRRHAPAAGRRVGAHASRTTSAVIHSSAHCVYFEDLELCCRSSLAGSIDRVVRHHQRPAAADATVRGATRAAGARRAGASGLTQPKVAVASIWRGQKCEVGLPRRSARRCCAPVDADRG